MVKRIAVINDLSGLGKCSLTAAIPVLSVMGVQACPLPTAILSNQTGYESYYYDDYTKHIDAYTDEWTKRGLTLDGIYTGFLGSEPYVAEAFGVETDKRTNIASQTGKYATSRDKIFTAGDVHRGQSLVVWAIAEGRACAKEVDAYLEGYSNM
mgnify:CR=1 FL=1